MAVRWAFALAAFVWAGMGGGCAPAPSHPSPTGPVAQTPVAEIAYVGEDYQVYMARPDGSEVRHVSQAIAGLSTPQDWRFRWPTYSPDGRRLAFAGYRERGGQLERATVVSADLQAQVTTTLLESSELAPIYLYWAPDSQQLTALLQRGQQLELTWLDGRGSREPVVLARGQPLYWSWTPNGRAIAVHIGGDGRVEPGAWVGLLHLDASGTREERFADRPGAFRAPAWSSDGSKLAYLGLVGGVSILSVRNSAGQGTRLAQSSTDLAFGWAPGSDWLAFSSASPATPQLYQGLEVARANGADRRRLTEDGLVAFYWSPDGKRLAYVGADLEARTLFWAAVALEGGERRRLAPFIPADDFAFQFPFFDQYAQSTSVWSPDSRHLVYAAESPAERRNGSSAADQINVLEVDGSGQAVTIAHGRVAVWSPRALERR